MAGNGGQTNSGHDKFLKTGEVAWGEGGAGVVRPIWDSTMG